MIIVTKFMVTFYFYYGYSILSKLESQEFSRAINPENRCTAKLSRNDALKVSLQLHESTSTSYRLGTNPVLQLVVMLVTFFGSCCKIKDFRNRKSAFQTLIPSEKWFNVRAVFCSLSRLSCYPKFPDALPFLFCDMRN